MTDETPVLPWTIKGIPPEDRNAAIAAATREGMTIGSWMCRAIRAQVQAERQQNRQPAVIAAPALPVAPPAPPVDASELRELVELIAMTADDKMPTPLARLTQGIVRNRLREIKRSSRGTRPV